MFKKILIGLVVVLGGLAAFIASRPAHFRLERSATFAAPADVAYALVSDFNRWGEWSPWDALDPQQKKTFEGTPGTVGHVTTWEGNDKVGQGKMTLTAMEPNASVALKLEFIKPMAATSTTTFTFKPAGEGTTVTWTMEGENDFMGKAFSVFMDMDKMVGGDFEKGLAKMKTAAETEAKKRAEAAAKLAAEQAAQQAAPAAPTAAQGTP